MNALTRIQYVLIDYENIQPKNLLLLAQESFHVAVFVGPNQDTIRVEVLDLMQRLGNDRVKHIKVADKGKNSLDFHLAYYLGRLVERNPDGHYHVISKDNGYDPLISHLGSRSITAYRHDDISRIPSIMHASAALPRTEPPRIESRPTPVPASASDPSGDLVIQLGSASKTGKSPLPPLASANFLHVPNKPKSASTPKPAQKQKSTPAVAQSAESASTTSSKASKPTAATAHAPADKVALVMANFSAHKANRPRTVKTLTNHLRSLLQKEKPTDAAVQCLIETLKGKGAIKIEGSKVSYPAK